MSINGLHAAASKKLKRELVSFQHAPSHAAALPKLRLLQWNVLADGLAQHGDFIKVDPEVLTWEARLPLILAEIQEAAADIVCLQEVNHYEELLATLEPLGYAGVFMPKQCSPALNYNCPADGMAVFFMKQRFAVKAEVTCHTFQRDGLRQNQGFLQLRLHDQVVHQDLVLITTHLKAKEGHDNALIRLEQVHQLLENLCHATLSDSDPAMTPTYTNGTGCHAARSSSNGCSAADHVPSPVTATSIPPPATASLPTSECATCRSANLPEGDRCPVIVCGDFNDVPSSPACQAMQTHPLRMRSIWDLPVAAEIPPEFSTWKFRSKGEAQRTIDYIWSSHSDWLVPLARWRMPSREEIGPAALPSAAYASDHVALMCEFAWDTEAANSSGIEPGMHDGNGNGNGVQAPAI